MLLALFGVIGMVGTLVWSKLYDPKEYYNVRYLESVSGLEVGTSVKMKGVRVGQVLTISVDRHGESVIVTLALDPGTPITEDTRATLTAIGVTGLQFVELDGGTARSRRIAPDTPRSIIKPGPSTLAILMKRGSRVMAKIDALRQNVGGLRSAVELSRVGELKHNVQRLVAAVEGIRSDSRGRLRRITGDLDRVTAAMDRATRALRALEGDADRKRKQTHHAALAAARSLERAVNEIRIEETEQVVERATGAIRRRAAGTSLERTAGSLAAASRQLARLSDQLGGAINRNSGQWSEIKKKLREAGNFINQLKRRFAK